MFFKKYLIISITLSYCKKSIQHLAVGLINGFALHCLSMLFLVYLRHPFFLQSIYSMRRFMNTNTKFTITYASSTNGERFCISIWNGISSRTHFDSKRFLHPPPPTTTPIDRYPFSPLRFYKLKIFHHLIGIYRRDCHCSLIHA